MTESVDTGNEAMARRLEELTAELHDLRSQVTSMRTPAGPGTTGSIPPNAGDQGTTTTEADPTMSRRRALRTAGAVAAGAVAASIATVATAGPAAAATGSFDGSPAVTATGTGLNSIGVSATGSQYAVQADGGATGQGLTAYGSGGGIYAYSDTNNGITTGGQTAAIVLGAYNAAPPTRSSVTFLTGSLTVDTSGNLWYCYELGAPGKWRQIAGSSTAGAFHPLDPGRVYDSRAALPTPGVLTSGSNRTISVADRRNPTTGAVVEANFVPVNATAVFANVTITDTATSGYLAVNPGGTITADSSVINWSANGQTLANGVALKLDASRQLTAVAGGPGSTDFIVDITGYWL